MNTQRAAPFLTNPVDDGAGLLRSHAAHTVGEIQNIRLPILGFTCKLLNLRLRTVCHLHQVKANPAPPCLQPRRCLESFRKLMDMTGHAHQRNWRNRSLLWEQRLEASLELLPHQLTGIYHDPDVEAFREVQTSQIFI